MITGDRRETAVAIAKDAGLLQRPNELVWTSAELAEMSDEQVKLELHKLRVVPAPCRWINHGWCAWHRR